jgi:DNA-directed RNA polymerase III subunit RPC1
MVKKAGSVVGIIHDRSKLSDGYLEECKSAIGHTREARAPIGLATYILNPVRVLSLFQRMVEEV